MRELAPIVLFAYNRPWHIEQTINALVENELAAESDLIIYSDGAKTASESEKVALVRNFIKTITGFNSIRIVERESNVGLGNNIIDGVTTIIKEYGKLIVLEDDLITSPYFLKFMNEGLHKYASAKNVMSVNGYIYPIKKKLPETFFIKGTDCLGWATWKDRWSLFEPDGSKLLSILEEKKLTTEFDFNNAYPYTQMLKDQIAGKNSSWAVRWYAIAFIRNMLALYPGRSLVYHNGNDGTGTHFGVSTMLDVKLSESTIKVRDIDISENKSVRKSIAYYLKYQHASWWRIICRRMKRMFLFISK